MKMNNIYELQANELNLDKSTPTLTIEQIQSKKGRKVNSKAVINRVKRKKKENTTQP